MKRPIRKKRSVTLIKEKSKEKLAKLHVEFNEKGQAIGVNQAEFTSYCGVVTRSRIDILIDSWDKVPKPQLDQLWLNIKV